MNFIKTKLEGCFIIKPKIFKDTRGFFYEFYRQDKFSRFSDYSLNFVQDNLARSSYGVVRGLHLQMSPFQQSKLLNVYEGKILDVVVDVRRNSNTYGSHIAVKLTSKNKKQLFIPKGFLHGYSVLSKIALVGYKCDEFYKKKLEQIVNPLDSILNINWHLPVNKMILSEKDKLAISFDRFTELNLK